MKIKIKPRTYYKLLYNYNNGSYDIIYTGTKWIYIVAEKYGTRPLEKHDKKRKWWTITYWQRVVNRNMYKTTELSKEDVFLELL